MQTVYYIISTHGMQCNPYGGKGAPLGFRPQRHKPVLGNRTFAKSIMAYDEKFPLALCVLLSLMSAGGKNIHCADIVFTQTPFVCVHCADVVFTQNPPVCFHCADVVLTQNPFVCFHCADVVLTQTLLSAFIVLTLCLHKTLLSASIVLTLC